MSVDKSTHLLLGVKISGEAGDKIGLPYGDDRWLPLLEGHSDCKLRVLYSQSGSEDCFYIGRELFSSDKGDSVSEVSHQLDYIADFVDVIREIRELGVTDYETENIGLWFVDTFN